MFWNSFKMKKVEYKKIAVDKIEHERYDIAYDFATKVYKNFKEVVKSVVLFGSVPKKEAKAKSDIDLIVIIDDCTIEWDQELIAWYREELAKLIAKEKYAKDLHVNTVTLSTFWEELKAGEPLVINVLRYGEALIDFGGFFNPLKILLAKGRIRPSPEAVFTTMKRAPDHLGRARGAILGSVEGFYWATVDAAHAALMAVNEIPPSPEHVSEMLNEKFVNKKMLNKKYVDYYEEIRKIAKEIIHGDVTEVDGRKVDDLKNKAEEFVKVLRDLTMILIKHEKIIRVEKKFI